MKRSLVPVAAAAALLISGVGWTPASASEEGNCTPVVNWCGGVFNDTPRVVTVSKNFNGQIYTDTTPLSAGGRTGARTDIDGVRIPVGCTAHLRTIVNRWGGEDYDGGAAYGSGTWHRIHDDEVVKITRLSCR
ncbi:hypothetical protein [Amycolatopsis sp. lyj-84]|uniref:hypothetical protein n=1 Tax=Amycolatopsis sp. lyj-84 TaxID=2789284 RepID=UPI003978504A